MRRDVAVGESLRARRTSTSARRSSSHCVCAYVLRLLLRLCVAVCVTVARLAHQHILNNDFMFAYTDASSQRIKTDDGLAYAPTCASWLIALPAHRWSRMAML